MLLTFQKGSLDRVSEHFAAKDFDCPCGHCSETHIDEDLVKNVQAVRDRAGRPVIVTEGGGCRCPWYEQNLRDRGFETSVGTSQHQLGRAADLESPPLTGFELEAIARKVGFLAVGVGRLFIHADLRPEYHRWEYKT